MRILIQDWYSRSASSCLQPAAATMRRRNLLLSCILRASLIAIIPWIAEGSHFRFGTIAWTAVHETYPCTDGEIGPAPEGTPCYLPFTHDGRSHAECTGHNTSTAAKPNEISPKKCDNTCSYSYDGWCDDGGSGSMFDICDIGTDCYDCGTRTIVDGNSKSDGFHAGPGGWCATNQNFDLMRNWGGCKMCTSVRKLRLKVHLAYRRSGVGGSRWIRSGDNNAIGDQYNAGIYIRWGDVWASHTLPMQVSAGGLSETWADSLGEFIHIYDGAWLESKRVSAEGGFTIVMRSCCRVGELINNHNAPYRLATFVNVTDFLRQNVGGDADQMQFVPGASPQSNQVPVVTLHQSSEPQRFDVSAFSPISGIPDNGGILFEWSTAKEMGIGDIDISRDRYNGDHLGMQLDPTTGELKWVTERAKLGLYSASIKVTDRVTNSYTLVDFIVKVVEPPPKFCSFHCLLAAGTICRDQSDCDIEACSAILESAGMASSSTVVATTGVDSSIKTSLENEKRVILHGEWSTKRDGEYVYHLATPNEIGRGDYNNCPVSRQYCTKALVHRKRGTAKHQSDPAYCRGAGYCYDIEGKQCHAPACADPAHSNSSTPRTAIFKAPPFGTRFGSGDYKVYLRFPMQNARKNLATNVPIVVRHANGIDRFTVDSSNLADSQWHALGEANNKTFRFATAVNLAFGKPSTQSSELEGGYASLAVDGRIDSNRESVDTNTIKNPTCTQTKRVAKQWWRVDLGAIYDIEEIVIVGNSGKNRKASTDLEVRVGTTVTGYDEDNQNTICGSDSNLYAAGTTVSVLCKDGTSGRYINIRRATESALPDSTPSPGLSLCEVLVYKRSAVSGYVAISTAGANGIVVADAVRFQPLADSMRSQCSSNPSASIVFPDPSKGGPMISGGTVYGSIGKKISFDVEANDQNLDDEPRVNLIGAPTPNATFRRVSEREKSASGDEIDSSEPGLKMEIFKTNKLSRSDQCKCGEFGPLLGQPKTFNVRNINHASFDYGLMDGLAELGLTKQSHGDHILIRWTGFIRIPFDGEYIFSAKSDDCVTVSIDATSVMKDYSCHAPRVRNGQPVNLKRGRHSFQATFAERTGRSGVVISWQGPGIPQPTVIPAAAFSDSSFNFEEQFLGCYAAAVPTTRVNFLIKNRDGICLDASQRNRRGGKVHMWNCNEKNKNQMWTYNRITGQIRNNHGICLDASQRNLRGGKVHMWTCNTQNKNQMWDYDHTSGQIKNKHGICLDASQRGKRGGMSSHYSTREHKNISRLVLALLGGKL